MEHLGVFEWLLILGLGVALSIAIGRASKPSRPKNTFTTPEDDRPSRSEQGMQALKDKMARKAAIKPELELTSTESMRIDKLIRDGQTIEAIKMVRTATGTSLKNAKDYVDARKEELD